jgi:multidrug efflux pump subunit AcrB
VRTELPENASFDYKGESLEYVRSSGAIYFTFVLALLVVYLVMAAQFESFCTHDHPVHRSRGASRRPAARCTSGG